MKTVKLTIVKFPDVLEDIRIFSNIVRMAFKRFQEGLSEKDIRAYIKTRISHNSWFIQSAIKEAQVIYKVHGNNKVVFGGKFSFQQYLKGLITKEQLRHIRSFPVCSYGERLQAGNRLFEFDILNNRIVYKPSCGVRKEFQVCPIKKRLARELAEVQELAEQKKLPVTVKFTDRHLYLTYDETLIYNEAYKGLKQNRVLGIDMNPNYIGVSVIEFDKADEFKVLHKEVFDLSALTKPSGEASQHKKSKYYTNKLKHETLAIAHRINRLVNYWKCAKLAIEDLSIKPAETNKGRNINRLCNNKWERQLFVNKLKMLAGIHKYEFVAVNPAYSSIVGNFAYGSPTTPDMVAASIEIARRAYKKFEKGWFYPKFNVETLDERWKQTLAGVNTWKSLFLKVKESKLKYRFLLMDYVHNAVLCLSKPHKKWVNYLFPLDCFT